MKPGRPNVSPTSTQKKSKDQIWSETTASLNLFTPNILSPGFETISFRLTHLNKNPWSPNPNAVSLLFCPYMDNTSLQTGGAVPIWNNDVRRLLRDTQPLLTTERRQSWTWMYAKCEREMWNILYVLKYLSGFKVIRDGKFYYRKYFTSTLL